MVTKTCKIHGKLALKDIKSGVYKGKKYAKCRMCENVRAQKYYAKEENKEKKRVTDRTYWKNNKDKIVKQREAVGYNETRKKTYKANPEKYRTSCNKKQAVYRDDLHDSYVKRVIKDSNPLIHHEQITEGMIELKRSIMLLKRGIRKHNAKEIGGRLRGKNR